MNGRKIIIPIFIASAVVFVIGVCINMFLEFDDSLRSTFNVESHDETEETTTPISEGYLTVFDYAGVTHFQYEGEIIIENDGSNGEPINIQIYVPNEDPTYQLEE